ncbi:MAG: hypothetical protein D6706_19265 [Chloroflexi bacterium]|nr:MAG: hypothetical protein D6706_19265 [Chloroflexota bacterium]
MTSWERDVDRVVNHVRVKGGFENILTEETITGSGTTFTLTHKPSGSFKVVVGGSEVSPQNYTVDAENKTVTFTTSQTNPTFTYTYNRPVVVEYQDDDSINTYGENYKEIPAPWLTDLADARKYAKEFVNAWREPPVTCQLIRPTIDTTIDVNEKITVVDSIRNESEQLTITKIVWDSNGRTIVTLGSNPYIEGDWKREVQDRIKKIERRFFEQDEQIFSRLIKHKLKAKLNLKVKVQYASPVDSFLLGHLTLGRLRSGFDAEPDCSNNNNNGTWAGSGVTTGSQYTTSGWRLSAGQFNGTDRKITVPHDATLDITTQFTIAFAIKVSAYPGSETPIIHKYSSNTGYKVVLRSDGTIRIYIGQTTGYLSATSTATIGTGSWKHIVIVRNGTTIYFYFDGTQETINLGSTNSSTNTTNLTVGSDGTNYFSGELDEIMIFNTNLSSAEATEIYEKRFWDNHARWANCVLWLAMDNPKLGNRIGTKTTHYTDW